MPDLTYSSVAIPSNFPPSSRPILIYPITPMSRKDRDLAYPLMASAVAKVLLLHPTDRILVHTVSYDFTRYLESEISSNTDLARRLVTYTSSAGKKQAIDRYLRQSDAALLAPSLDRGIDLPEDQCRVVVVCKVPIPSLGDRQVSARLYGTGRAGRTWYAVQTIRSLVQMTGRGMRSSTDSCTTYILDAQFVSNLYRQHRSLFPEWWTEALVMDRGKL